MPKNKRPIKLYVSDIKQAVGKIEKFTWEMDKKVFETDEKTIDAVVRNLEIIGEAVNKLPTDFKLKYKDIPWQKMIGMRNKVIHEYFGVDWEILWQTVKEDMPELKKFLDKITKFD